MTNPSLLRAILEDPFDDDRRLVYADWLEEAGDNERAEFIRVQIYLAKLTGTVLRDRAEQKKYSLSVRRENELLNGPSPIFWGNDIPLPTSPRNDCKDWGATWRRGFISGIKTKCAWFMDHAEEFFRNQPIIEVKLTDKMPSPSQLTDNYRTPFVWEERGDLDPALPHVLPTPLFQAMKEIAGAGTFTVRLMSHNEPDAYAYLSAACVHYGRQLAGLPEIHLPDWENKRVENTVAGLQAEVRRLRRRREADERWVDWRD